MEVAAGFLGVDAQTWSGIVIGAVVSIINHCIRNTGKRVIDADDFKKPMPAPHAVVDVAVRRVSHPGSRITWFHSSPRKGWTALEERER
jgi:hypothetical protein